MYVETKWYKTALYHTKSLDHYHRVIPKLCTLNVVGGEPPRCNCGSCGAHHKSSSHLTPDVAGSCVLIHQDTVLPCFFHHVEAPSSMLWPVFFFVTSAWNLDVIALVAGVINKFESRHFDYTERLCSSYISWRFTGQWMTTRVAAQ